MKTKSFLKSFVLFLAVFSVIVVVGYLLTDEMKARSARQNVRNVNVEMQQRDLSFSGSPQQTEEAIQSDSSSEASEEAKKVAEAESEEEKAEDPVALAEALDRSALSGRFETIDEEPIANIPFTFKFQNSIKDGKKPPSYKGASDENGTFRVEKMLAGSYVVDAGLSGFKKFKKENIKTQAGAETSNLTLVMEPNLELKGKVVDEQNKPVYGARVLISRTDISLDQDTNEAIRQESIYREVSTTQKGDFHVQKIAPGIYIFRILGAGYLPIREEIKFVNKSISGQNRELAPASSIGGIVRTIDGEPIFGAKLKAYIPENPKQFWEIESLENGRFFFPAIPKDHFYAIEAKAAGFAQATVKEIPDGRTNIVIDLYAGGTISGRVIDFNSNLVVPNVPISCFLSADENLPIARVRSDAFGNYKITDLAAGEYNVKIVSETLTSEPHLGVKVDVGKEIKDKNFSVYPGEEIRGFVLDGVTGERINDAKIALNSQVGPAFLSNQKRNVQSDEFGSFEFTNLPYGFYQVSATAEGYLLVPGGESVAEVQIVPGDESEPVELFLYRGGTITGQVVGPEGAPVSNAKIQVYNDRQAKGKLSSKQLGKFEMETATNGTFTITGIPLDQQLLLVISATAQGFGKGKSEPVLLTEQMPDASIIVPVGIGHTITVNVEDKNGLSISGARVRFNSSEFPGDKSPPEWSKETAEIASVTFIDIPEGRGSVSASKKGYFSDSQSVVIPRTNENAITLVLEESTFISGRLLDDGGVPFSDGYVNARAERGARGGGRGNVDADGFFKIEGIGPGQFRLDARGIRQTPTGKHQVEDQKRYIPSEAEGVEFRIPMRGGIEAMIIDGETLDPMPKATVSISGKYKTSTGGNKTFRSRASTNVEPGKIKFESIPPGEYTASISASGYLPQFIEDIRISSPGTFSLGQIVLSKGGVIRGTVIDSISDKRISSATVKLDPSGKASRTNGKGEFYFSGLDADIYSLIISHPDYLTKTFDFIQVPEGGEADAGVLSLDIGASLEVIVDDGVGKPVNGASVVVRNEVEGWEQSGRTNAGGRSTIRGLKAGGVDVSVTGTFPNGKITQSDIVALSAGETTELEVTLFGDNVLSGQILPSAGLFLSSAQVSIYPFDISGRPVRNGRINAEMSGLRFYKDELPRGAYLLCLQANNSNGGIIYWHYTVSINKPTTDVSVSVPLGKIKGKVFAQNEAFQFNPLIDAEVTLNALTFPHSNVSGFNNWTSFKDNTDGLGYYEIPNLSVGVYEIRISHKDFDVPYVDIIRLESNSSQVTHDAIFEEESLY